MLSAPVTSLPLQHITAVMDRVQQAPVSWHPHITPGKATNLCQNLFSLLPGLPMIVALLRDGMPVNHVSVDGPQQPQQAKDSINGKQRALHIVFNYRTVTYSPQCYH